MEDRNKISSKAAWIGVFANAILAAMKIFVGLFFKSMAVLADGIDTSTDIFTSLVTLVSSKISNRPPDKTHPYGHERVEAIAAKVVSFVIFYAGANLMISSIRRIVSGEHILIVGILPLLISLVSVAVKTWLFLYKYRVGKKIKSYAFIADALNMRNDILISSTVFAGLVLNKIGLLWVDGIVALIISVMIIKTAFEIFKETSYELMDGMTSFDIYDQIFKAVKDVQGAANPHKVRVRQVGYKYFVDMDIEVSGAMSVQQGHDIATQVKRAIIEQNDRIADVMVHVEPIGNVEREAYGLSQHQVSDGGGEN
ncbi:MAG TPA: cation diffusion facilitator family transporter [Pseudothermotoga sp.]|nr:cation diffusion facilitator family transporter [Pseudothermotoga sp.]HOK84598.1 cation diffusion facilitator family transporter [Pseudothermotoga sp.]HPP69223.1 cation diffusion facilitator family transporter [Pseudothermotoga sp.]